MKRIRNPGKFVQNHIPYLEGLLKKSIAEIKFPFAEKQGDVSNLDPIVDSESALDQQPDFEEILEPEENWMNKNKHGSSQSILTLQTTKSRSYRSKFSILNPQNILTCQRVPNLSNGFVGGGMATKNTCAFDCIFSLFACLYSDYGKFKQSVDGNIKSSTLCALIKKVMMHPKKLKLEIFSKKIYTERNKMLYNLAGKSGKVTELTSLDCEAGFGGFFSNICKKNEIFATSVLVITCDECETLIRIIRPLFPSTIYDLDLRNIQTFIVDPTGQEEFCRTCNHLCKTDHTFGSVISLEVEPITADSAEKIRVGEITPQINVSKKIWNLCGVVENIGGHFISHVLRRNNTWETYDDLTEEVIPLDTSKEIFPIMVFFLCSGKSHLFFLSVF